MDADYRQRDAQGNMNTEREIRVMILSEDRLFREGLVRLMDSSKTGDSSVSIAGIIDRWEGAAKRIGDHAPEIILVDYKLARNDGLRHMAGLRQMANVKCIVVGVPDHENDIIPCLEAGAAGYVPIDASIEDLIHIVTAVSQGRSWCSDRFAAFLFSKIQEFADDKFPDPREETRLTAREFEVIELLADGLTNKEIAERLGIETQTVKNHVHHLLEKLSVHRRMDAVAYARQRHWFRR